MLQKKNPVLHEFLKHFGLVSQLGFSVVISILIFVFAFNYLDKKLHTNGNLLIIGVLIGVSCGITIAYRLVSKHYKSKHDRTEQEK